MITRVTAATLLAAAFVLPGSAAAAHAQDIPIPCGFLDDGNGSGSAASLQPGVTVTGGLQIYQENAGAWRVCYDSDPTVKTISLVSAPGFCFASNSGEVKLRACRFQEADQQWNQVPVVGGTEYQNVADGAFGIMCAQGGVGSEVITTSEGACSTYHETYAFRDTP